MALALRSPTGSLYVFQVPDRADPGCRTRSYASPRATPGDTRQLDLLLERASTCIYYYLLSEHGIPLVRAGAGPDPHELQPGGAASRSGRGEGGNPDFSSGR